MIDYKKKMTIGKAKKILRGFLAKDCYIETPLYYAIPYLLDYITNLQEDLETVSGSHFKIFQENKILKEERKTLYKYTSEKGFRLVGDEDVKR